MHDARYNDLCEIRKLSIVCDDCGRRVVWRRHRIAAAQVRHSVRSTLQLGTKLCCRACQARDAPGRNISIYVDSIEEPVGEILL